MPQIAASVDIETWSVKPNAMIVGLGFCIFEVQEPHNVLATLGVAIDAEDPNQAGRAIDPGTMKWWLQQKKEAQDALFTDATNLRNALRQLNDLWTLHQPQTIWAKSPSFDCVILENAYAQVGSKCPWWFSQTRDVRTVQALAETKIGGPAPSFFAPGATAHNALDDALAQAALVQWGYAVLTGG